MKTSEGSAINAGQPSPMPDISYAIDEKGVITRTDKDSTLIVATYDAGTQTVEFASDDAMKFRAPCIRFLNDKDLPWKVVTKKGAPKDKVDETAIPPRPKMDPQFGDKTPAVVEWYQRYRPEEYKIRYGVKGPGTVTKQDGFDTNPKTGEKTPRYVTVDAIVATRKTHLTEKLEAADDNGGDE